MFYACKKIMFEQGMSLRIANKFLLTIKLPLKFIDPNFEEHCYGFRTAFFLKFGKCQRFCDKNNDDVLSAYISM